MVEANPIGSETRDDGSYHESDVENTKPVAPDNIKM